jgi:ferredoxin
VREGRLSSVDILGTLDLTLRALNTRIPEVDPRRCVATRYRASSCRRCTRACPGGAIAPTPNLEVDPEKCLGCGACAVVCPTGALDFAQPRAALRARLRAAGDPPAAAATIACARSDAPIGRGAGIKVECLGCIAAADLLIAQAAGVRTLDLVDGGCTACPSAAAVKALPEAIYAATALFAALGSEPQSDTPTPDGPKPEAMMVTRLTSPDRSSGAPAVGATGADHGDGQASDRTAGKQAAARWAGPVLSRRQLLLFFGARSAQVVETSAVKRKATSVESLHAQSSPPPTHQLLVRHLDHLALHGIARADFATCMEPLHLAAVTVSAACDSCGLCARYCPHGALKVAEGVVAADHRLCTACGLCAEVCPPEAIALRPPTLPLAARA